MSFDAYAKWFNERRHERSVRPLLFNPDHPVISLFISIAANIGFAMLAVLSMSWFGWVEFDALSFDKPYPLVYFIFFGVVGWTGERRRYRKAVSEAETMMIGPDQPAEKTT